MRIKKYNNVNIIKIEIIIKKIKINIHLMLIILNMKNKI